MDMWILAAFGIMIAYFQWRTAHQRVALDLFDRRFDLYNEITDCIGLICTSMGRVSPEQKQKIYKAIKKANFLFGTKVSGRLYYLYNSIDFLSYYFENAPEVQKALIEQFTVNLKIVTDFGEEAPSLFEPYMRLDQRLDWSRSWARGLERKTRNWIAKQRLDWSRSWVSAQVFAPWRRRTNRDLNAG